MSSIKNRLSLITGLVILLAVIGYYGYLIVDAKRVTASSSVSYPRVTLDDNLLVSLLQKDLNGELPLKVSPEELGNPQPFTKN